MSKSILIIRSNQTCDPESSKIMQSPNRNNEESTWMNRNSGKIVTGALVLLGCVGVIWKVSKNQKPTKKELEKMKNDILNGLSYPQ